MAILNDNHFITLEDLKKYLGIEEENTEYDDLLIQLINSSSQWIMTAIGRDIMKAKHIDVKKGNNKQYMTLKFRPIKEVVKISNPETGNQILNVDKVKVYTTDEDFKQGVLYFDGGFRSSGFARGLEPDIYPLSMNTKIEYIAGYTFPSQADENNPVDIPSDLIQLVLDRISFSFAKHSMGGEGLSAFSISDVSWSFESEPTEEWNKIINQYKEAF